MSKRKDVSGHSNQLEFSWNGNGQRTGVASGKAGNVVRLLDAATLSIRREAVERVARSGIFRGPVGKR